MATTLLGKPNECETFDLWFQRQQGVAYAGMYAFAKASYQHQQEIITNLEENLQQIVADNVQLQAKLNEEIEISNTRGEFIEQSLAELSAADAERNVLQAKLNVAVEALEMLSNRGEIATIALTEINRIGE
jgi:hypothetical protein